MKLEGIIIMANLLTLNDYTITEDGRIINDHTGRILTPQPNGKGYLRVSIGGHLEFVHRLVAEIYVPNPYNKPQVNHKNGDKTDNRACNLEWVDNTENKTHAMIHKLVPSGEKCSWSKLNWDAVHFIRQHPEISLKKLGEKFGVAPSTISDVRQGRSWKEN